MGSNLAEKLEEQPQCWRCKETGKATLTEFEGFEAYVCECGGRFNTPEQYEESKKRLYKEPTNKREKWKLKS